MVRFRLRLLLASCLFAFWRGSVAAQPLCVGDCDGDGTVTIDEILTMVNVALDALPSTACEAGDANHDSLITVDEVLAAVNNALTGCQFDVSGTWEEDQYNLLSSECNVDLTNAVSEEVSQPPVCDYQLVQ